MNIRNFLHIALLIIAVCLLAACGGGGGSGGGSSNGGGGSEDGEITYSVSFEANGGSAVPAMTGVSSVDTEPFPTKDSFLFGGWFTDPSFSGWRVKFPYTLTVDTTFYARWLTGARMYSVQSRGSIALPEAT